jgi:menaquinone-9 beta-reductase
MKKLKVIVVGGGPAGCAAAYRLAGDSIDVTVVESGQPGKDKTCGDALVPSAINLIGRFGIGSDRIQALGGRRFHNVDLYQNETLFWRFDNEQNQGWVVPRKIIDQEIRNTISSLVSIQYKTTVTGLTTDQSGEMKLSLKLKDGNLDDVTGDAVILATGSANELSCNLGIDGSPVKGVSISAYAEMAAGDSLIFQFLESCQPGYRWIFPVSEKTVNSGVWLRSEKPNINLKGMGEDLLAHFGARRFGKWRGGWEPLWSGTRSPRHHPCGIVSCGDAAGLVNPFTGEGMTAALASGEQAGIAISRYLRENKDPDKLEAYSQWVNEYFIRQYSLESWKPWGKLSGIDT